MYLCHNFDIVRPEQAELTVQNRAFAYGDGLFETMIVHGGRIRFFDEHVARMEAGMAALRMDFPEAFSPSWLKVCVARLIERNQLRQEAAVRVRWQVVRRPGGRYVPTDLTTDFYLTTEPARAPRVRVLRKVSVAETVSLTPSPYARYKTCNALPYVLAGIEQQRRGTDDLLLLDQHDNLAELTAANLFWVHDDVLFTPALETGCVAGVMRQAVLDGARAEGLSVEEGLFSYHDLLEATYAFGTNVQGLYPIASIDRTLFSPRLRWTFLSELLT